MEEIISIPGPVTTIALCRNADSQRGGKDHGSVASGDLALVPDEVMTLTSIARSRIEPASRVERARMLLAYRDNPTFFAVGQALGVHHHAAATQTCPSRRSGKLTTKQKQKQKQK